MVQPELRVGISHAWEDAQADRCEEPRGEEGGES